MREAMFQSLATVKSHARYRFPRPIPASFKVLKMPSK
jgi:hypothetical protein